MRPEYETRLGERKAVGLDDPSTAVTVATRIPKSWSEKLSFFADSENDTAGRLIHEAVFRLIDDRESDPEYMAKLPKRALRKVYAEEDHRIAMMEHVLEETRRRRGDDSGPAPESPS